MTKEFVESCDAMMRIEGKSPFICFCCRSKVAKFGSFVKESRQETQEVNKELQDVKKELQTERLERQLLAAQVQALVEKILRMEGSTEQVTTKLVDMEKELESGMEKAKQEVKQDMATELREQEQRAENVVIYGVEESKKEEKEDREAEDVTKVHEVVEAIGIQDKSAIEVKFRAGKKVDGGKPRPIVVKIADEETRAKVLANARHLSRKPAWQNVYVGSDMTFKQREEARKRDAELWEEANRKTEEAKNDGREEERYVVIGQRGKDRRIVLWRPTGERGRRV